MNLLREFGADYLALPEVQFFLKWWWVQAVLIVVVFSVLAMWPRGRR